MGKSKKCGGEIARDVCEKTIPFKKRRSRPVSVSEPPFNIIKSSGNSHAEILANDNVHNQRKIFECLTQILDTLKSLEMRIDKFESNLTIFNQKNKNRSRDFVCHRLSVPDKSTLKMLGLPIDSVLDLEKTEKKLENDDYIESVVSDVKRSYILRLLVLVLAIPLYFRNQSYTKSVV